MNTIIAGIVGLIIGLILGIIIILGIAIGYTRYLIWQHDKESEQGAVEDWDEWG